MSLEYEKHPLDVLAINESKIDVSISDNKIKMSRTFRAGGTAIEMLAVLYGAKCEFII